MRHVSARTQPHSVAPHHIRSSSKIRYFFDFFAHPRFLRTLAHPPQTNAPSHPPSHSSAKPLSGIVCRPIACGNTGSGYAIAPNGAIRSAYRPISLSLNTGSLSPYFAIAQYGLFVALFRYRSIRAQARPYCLRQYGLWLRYCPEWGNTLRISPYFALWAQYGLLSSRGCAPLHPGLYSGAPSGRSRQARAQSIPPATRASSPLACHKRPQRGRLPPSHAINARNAGVFPPRPIYHICRRQMSIPPRPIYHIEVSLFW